MTRLTETVKRCLKINTAKRPDPVELRRDIARGFQESLAPFGDISGEILPTYLRLIVPDEEFRIDSPYTRSQRKRRGGGRDPPDAGAGASKRARVAPL
jgi:hypothetical protein